VRLGKFVKIVGQKYEYFCLVTDVQLDAANPDVLRDPPGDPSTVDTFLRDVLSGTTTYATIKLKPELMLANPATDAIIDQSDLVPRPARTIPPHFSGVSEATIADFERVFGRDDGKTHFQIGQPIDMDVPVCLDLRRFVERSNGIFGKSGTGKSFLTRLILSGVIRAQQAVNLIFDMHSEYGWSAKNEEGTEVKGLSQLFGGRVAVYTLDMDSSRGRGVRPAGEIKIALRELSVGDITLLQDELKLHRTAVESAALCEDKLGDDWAARLLEMSGDQLQDFAGSEGGNHASLAALRSKLRMIDRLPFVERTLSRSTLDELIARLERGHHVVLEFGRQRSMLAYILAANVITRRLHELWTSKTERYWNTKDESDRPRPLMITIEEAHKFLNADAAHQTTFGTIARELRKFYVTLLVVDQRPSGIDAEVLSQIGTRITCQLNDERDIDAIFTGVSGGPHLRSVLATLDSREQALVLGHAVPMPMMVRTRKYDASFYAAIGADEPAAAAARARRYEEIFGPDA
jgi:DNA helicase HerA-like ATPase